MTSPIIKKVVPTIILTVIAIWMIVEYFVTPVWVSDVGTEIRNFAIILSSFAVALGGVSSTSFHAGNVLKKIPDRWQYSLVLLIAMVTMVVTGLMGWLQNPVFSFLWNNVTVPCQQTVYSLLMFYLAIAAYRALRASSKESIIFMISAIIIMLTNGPFTESLIPGMTELGGWLFAVPNMGSARGFLISTTIGMVALYIRTLLGREAGMIGAEKGE